MLPAGAAAILRRRAIKCRQRCYLGSTILRRCAVSPPAATAGGFYARRIIGGDCHHRHSDFAVAAGDPVCSRGRPDSECGNNMRQISLGLLSHHDARRVFPPGTYDLIDTPDEAFQNRRCWMHDLLPYIGEEALYEQFTAWMIQNDETMTFPLNTSVVTPLMCPSDPIGPKLHTIHPGGGDTNGVTNSQGFSGNIVVCGSSNVLNPGPDPLTCNVNSTNPSMVDGLMFATSAIRIKNISDGTNHTAMVGEIILTPDVSDDDLRGRYYNPTCGGVTFTTKCPPNTAQPDRVDWCSAFPVPGAPCIANQSASPGLGNLFLSVRSYHPGGVNLGLADGSVRFVGDEVDPVTYTALGSRNSRGAQRGLLKRSNRITAAR